MTSIIIGMLLIFGFAPAMLVIMGCAAVVDRIRRGKRQGPVSERRTLPELLPAAPRRFRLAFATG